MSTSIFYFLGKIAKKKKKKRNKKKTKKKRSIKHRLKPTLSRWFTIGTSKGDYPFVNFYSWNYSPFLKALYEWDAIFSLLVQGLVKQYYSADILPYGFIRCKKKFPVSSAIFFCVFYANTCKPLSDGSCWKWMIRSNNIIPDVSAYTVWDTSLSEITLKWVNLLPLSLGDGGYS